MRVQTIANASRLNIDSSSVSIGGLSAGGQMTAVLGHFARDAGVDLKLQLIIVPATDMRYCLRTRELNKATCPYESVLLYHDAPWGPLGREQWFLKYWLGDDDGTSFLSHFPCANTFITKLTIFQTCKKVS
jgi:acetyl esterase/lipase